MDENIVSFPELFFGVVAPVGVDLDLAFSLTKNAMTQLGYVVEHVRVTDVVYELFPSTPTRFESLEERYKILIEKSNAIRSLSEDDRMMAILTLSAIRRIRAKHQQSRDREKGIIYFIRQLKRPEEINLFRKIYGKQFFQISLYADKEARSSRLAKEMRKYDKSQSRSDNYHVSALKLMQDDEYQEMEESGQRLRDVFPLGDVFIDVSNRKTGRETISRFSSIVFGYNFHSPSRDEYGMYAAAGASLRSVDLSRQVGAAVFSSSGEVLVQGCNEVPSRFGGTYWEGDEGDSREFQIGYDANDDIKLRLLTDVLDNLSQAGALHETFKGLSAKELFAKIKTEQNLDLKKRIRIMDIIEYGRIVHAEMNAITDAARKGVPLKGSTLYCTTFPCHICAKHIIASGIKKVVYLEPYPKSFAEELYSDEISVGRDGSIEDGKVCFQPFIGIAPHRYRDLFMKGRRKDGDGRAQDWATGVPSPIVRVTAVDQANYEKSEQEYVAYGATRRTQKKVGVPQAAT